MFVRFDQGLGRSAQSGKAHSSILKDNDWTALVHWWETTLAKRVIALFPEHTTYVEAFAGGAQVFFHKEPSKVEVLNDLDGEIVNFFRVCQQHYEELLRYFRFCGREPQMVRSPESNRSGDAHRYPAGGAVSVSPEELLREPRPQSRLPLDVVQPPGFNLERLPELIENAHKRLARVQIECLPYEEVLKRFDRPTTLFYLDPPYLAGSSTATTSRRQISRSWRSGSEGCTASSSCR